MCKIWVSPTDRAPNGYLHCDTNAIAMIDIQREEQNNQKITRIDISQDYVSSIQLLEWLVQRGTRYPIKLRQTDKEDRAKLQEYIQKYWK